MWWKYEYRLFLLAVAMIFNILALIFTDMLLDSGMGTEANPIMCLMFQSGFLVALLFALGIWGIYYILIIYIPERAKGEYYKKVSCVITAGGVCFAGFDMLHDLLLLI